MQKTNNIDNKQNIKVVIAAHKKYRMPDGEIYLPVQVGAAGKESIGYQRDDEGDNISSKNPYFCELTGLYWAWKNVEYDYLGLVHYRRHLTLKSSGDRWSIVLSDEEASELCSQYDIILPSKRYYFIETLESHYDHTHYKEHLEVTRDVLKDRYPDYVPYFDKTLKQTSAYMFNMFIMNKELVNEYCEFLFGLLFALEDKIDYQTLSAFHARFFGRIGELMFDVWLNKKLHDEPQIKTKTIKCVHMEKINWIKKGGAFLKAKFFGKKYENGF